MSTIKKAYVDIVTVLQENENAKVSDVLPKIIEIASAKSGGGGGSASSFHRDENGEVVAVKCYYFGKWMDPKVVEFGVKKSSASGLNSMCKEGTSHWTKQQRVAKAAQEELLDRVAAGEQVDVRAELDAIEETRKQVVESDLPMYDTLEDCLAAL